MTNEITIYNGVTNPVSAMDSIGKAITKSQLFGCQSEAQGQVLALECMAQKLPPLSLAKRFDLMNGKLSMKSQTMLADFRTTGGKTRMIEKSAEAAAIWMQDKEGNEYKFDLTWAEAMEETFPYAGKESDIIWALANDRSKLKLKPKYATPRSRANMLWNRLISDSVRTIAPEINCGQYTPDEIEDFTQATINGANTSSIATIEQPIATVGVEEVEVEDAEFNVAADVEPSTEELVEQSAIEQRPANTNDQRTTDVEDGPCSDAAVDGIKAAIDQWEQLSGEKVVPRVKAILEKAGNLKLADLTISEAAQLRSAIDEKNLEHWLNHPLRAKAEAKNETSQS